MWCAYAGDGIYKAETDCGTTLVGIDEAQGLPWRGINLVSVVTPRNGEVCVMASIGAKLTDPEPMSHREYLIAAACRDMRTKAQRETFLQRVAGTRACAEEYRQRIWEVQAELRRAQARQRGYLESSRAHGDDDYSYYYEGMAEGASYEVECWQETLANLRRKRRNAQRREKRNADVLSHTWNGRSVYLRKDGTEYTV